jgi:hypothetical protein
MKLPLIFFPNLAGVARTAGATAVVLRTIPENFNTHRNLGSILDTTATSHLRLPNDEAERSRYLRTPSGFFCPLGTRSPAAAFTGNLEVTLGIPGSFEDETIHELIPAGQKRLMTQQSEFFGRNLPLFVPDQRHFAA